MLILTLKERDIIDDAVDRFGNDRDREIWRMWKVEHPDVKYSPDQRSDDGRGDRFPQAVTRVALEALEKLERAIRIRIDSAAISEDEAYDLCNDMAEVHSTAEVLRAA